LEGKREENNNVTGHKNSPSPHIYVLQLRVGPAAFRALRDALVLVGVRDRPLVVKAEQPGFCRYEETDVSSDLSTSHTHTKSQLRAHTMRKHKHDA